MFVTVLQAKQESKFCMPRWILHGYRNAMKPLRPLQRSSILGPLTGMHIVIVELADYHLDLVLAHFFD